MKKSIAAVVFAGLVSAAQAAAAQEHELSFYLGVQSAPHSVVDFDDAVAGPTRFTAGWEGRSFEVPPYYGFRYTYWLDDAWGFGVEMNHAKVYADNETLADSGFSDLELTDGLNIITLNGFRRWDDPARRWTPYAGIGLGIAMPHVDARSPNGFRTFEYQITGPAAAVVLGLTYELDDTWSVFGEYKGTYSMNDIDLAGGETLETDIVTNALNVGLSFRF